MDLNVDLEERERYLYIAVHGDFELRQAMTLFSEVLDLARNAGQQNILIDYRDMHGSPSATEEYEYACFVADHLQKQFRGSGSPMPRLAYVGQTPDPGFGENVAVNRGAVLMDTPDLDEAIEWLLGSSGRRVSTYP